MNRFKKTPHIVERLSDSVSCSPLVMQWVPPLNPLLALLKSESHILPLQRANLDLVLITDMIPMKNSFSCEKWSGENHLWQLVRLLILYIVTSVLCMRISYILLCRDDARANSNHEITEVNQAGFFYSSRGCTFLYQRNGINWWYVRSFVLPIQFLDALSSQLSLQLVCKWRWGNWEEFWL